MGWVGGWWWLIGRISSSSSVHVIATRLALRWKRLVEGGIVTRVVMARWWWLSLLRAPVRVPIRPPWVPVWSHWCSASTILVLEVGRIVCRVNSIGRPSLVIGSRTPVGMRWLRIVHCHILLVIRCPLWVSWHGIVCRVLATTLIMLTLKMMYLGLRLSPGAFQHLLSPFTVPGRLTGTRVQLAGSSWWEALWCDLNIGQVKLLKMLFIQHCQLAD